MDLNALLIILFFPVPGLLLQHAYILHCYTSIFSPSLIPVTRSVPVSLLHPVFPISHLPFSQRIVVPTPFGVIFDIFSFQSSSASLLFFLVVLRRLHVWKNILFNHSNLKSLGVENRVKDLKISSKIKELIMFAGQQIYLLPITCFVRDGEEAIKIAAKQLTFTFSIFCIVHIFGLVP